MTLKKCVDNGVTICTERTKSKLSFLNQKPRVFGVNNNKTIKQPQVFGFGLKL